MDANVAGTTAQAANGASAPAPAVDERDIEEHWRNDLAAAHGDLLAATAPPLPEEEDRRAGFERMPVKGAYGLVVAIEHGPYDPYMAARPAELAEDCTDSVLFHFDPRAARLEPRAVRRLDEAWRHGNPCVVIPHPQSDVDPEALLLRILPRHPEARLDPPVPYAGQRLPARLHLRRDADPIPVEEISAPLTEAGNSRFVPEGQMARFLRRSGPEWLVANLGLSDEGVRQWAWTPLPADGDGGVHGGEGLWDWSCGDAAAARTALGRADPDDDPWLYVVVAVGLRAVWREARPQAAAHCSYHSLLPRDEWLQAEVPCWSFTAALHFAGTDPGARTWELLDRPRLEARIRDWTRHRRPAADPTKPRSRHP